MADFHFLRPLCLLAVLPALVLWWRIWRRQDRIASWRQFVDPHLLVGLECHYGSVTGYTWGAYTANGERRWFSGAFRVHPGQLTRARWTTCAIRFGVDQQPGVRECELHRAPVVHFD